MSRQWNINAPYTITPPCLTTPPNCLLLILNWFLLINHLCQFFIYSVVKYWQGFYLQWGAAQHFCSYITNRSSDVHSILSLTPIHCIFFCVIHAFVLCLLICQVLSLSWLLYMLLFYMTIFVILIITIAYTVKVVHCVIVIILMDL